MEELGGLWRGWRVDGKPRVYRRGVGVSGELIKIKGLEIGRF